MNRFAIARPRSFDEAATVLADDRFSLPVLKAGGMDVVDHLKEGLLEPDVLVDVRNVQREHARVGRVAANERLIMIEASATLAEIANWIDMPRLAPVVAQAVESAATPQVRNVATAAGNLLQRPRCWYYRNVQYDCLKKGGHTCYAVEGDNRYHAIFGDGPCHIVHPSNLAPALMVTNGRVGVIGGDRDEIPIAKLFHMPDRGLRSEHHLEPNEIITHIELDHAPTSAFYAVKEKQSFDWPLVAAAVALEMDGSVVRSARVCAAAVAPVPWRLKTVERALAGVDVDDDAALRAACAAATDGARPMSGNAYKLKMLPVAVRRAVLKAAGRGEEAWT